MSRRPFACRGPRRAVALLALLAALWPALPPCPPLAGAAGRPHPTDRALAALRAALAADLAAQPAGTLSVVYQDLASGARIALNATQPWDPASVVKLFVMAEAYHRRAAGQLSFDTTVAVPPDDVVPTAGFARSPYPPLSAGISVTVGSLVGAMITQSDNTAYNTLLDLLGRDRVAAYARALGLRSTLVARKLNLDGAAAAADAALAGGRENSTTAGDVARFYLALARGELPLSALMLHLLARQRQNAMLPAGLPPGTVIAHKPGEVDGTLRHDGGIASLPGGGAFLLVVFSSLGSYAELAGIARQVARAYPPPAPRPPPPPPANSLASLLRLLLALAAAGLLVLVVVVDRGLGRPRRR